MFTNLRRASANQVFTPTPRMASKYKPIEKTELAATSYPCGVSSLVPSLHDIQHYQAIMGNSNNFAGVTKCDIFELRGEEGVLQTDLDDAGLSEYLEESDFSSHETSLRAIFCNLEHVLQTSYGNQISMTHSSVEKVLNKFNVSPQFLPLLLAEPDYWSPGDFAIYDSDGEIQQTEFFCQQPRWNIHGHQTPWCIYMTYDVQKAITTYIIASFAGTSKSPNPKSHVVDPWLIHAMITHESLLEAKGIITKLRHRLYDQLDKVDEYAENSFERAELERLTIDLHGISQDTDSLLASADMAEMIATRMMVAHSRFETILGAKGTKCNTAKVTDSLLYLQASVQSQKRWLLSYKSRKDIAMNLVFNLVTQQDSATTTVIARETKVDSASMKTIAALTMVFLPGTFMSSVFGMKSTDGVPWWVYLTVTIPLTAAVITTWWIWTHYPVVAWLKTNFTQRIRVGLPKRRKSEECKV